MRLKQCISSILSLILLSAAASALSQVVPAAHESGLSLVAGGGFSNYNADWANERIDGAGLWVDWYPNFIPRRLSGLGLEFEAHHLGWNRPSRLPANFRQDTGGGGAIYSWHHFTNFRPYAKGLIEFGSFDFTIPNSTYHHDTRTVFAVGAGLDYHIWGHIWARGDYEYQTWQQMFGRHDPTPNGFTFGAMYDLRRTGAKR